MKIAILASGSGTNARAIIDKCASGILKASVSLVASNRPGAKVLERAAKTGIKSMALDHTAYPDRLAFDLALVSELDKSGCDYVVLAGYMRLLTPEFLAAFPGRVLNIHPAILPSFPGTHGATDALAYGVKLSGATVHFVEEKMDSGPVLIQAAVPVMADDTADSLQTRIHSMEYRIYPQALQWLATGRISTSGRKVILAPDPAIKRAAIADAFVWPPLEEGF